ncbi:MAG: hypothetical protein WD267_10190 [Balneolales bacterium]
MDYITTNKVRKALLIVFASYLLSAMGFSQANVTTLYDVALHVSPTEMSNVTLVIPKRTQLEAQEFRSGYWRVTHDDTEGWVLRSVTNANTAAGVMERSSTRTSTPPTQTRTATPTSTPSTRTAPTRRTAAVQCSGTTQKGLRCKRRTKNLSGRCYQH